MLDSSEDYYKHQKREKRKSVWFWVFFVFDIVLFLCAVVLCGVLIFLLINPDKTMSLSEAFQNKTNILCAIATTALAGIVAVVTLGQWIQSFFKEKAEKLSSSIKFTNDRMEFLTQNLDKQMSAIDDVLESANDFGFSKAGKSEDYSPTRELGFEDPEKARFFYDSIYKNFSEYRDIVFRVLSHRRDQFF